MNFRTVTSILFWLGHLSSTYARLIRSTVFQPEVFDRLVYEIRVLGSWEEGVHHRHFIFCDWTPCTFAILYRMISTFRDLFLFMLIRVEQLVVQILKLPELYMLFLKSFLKLYQFVNIDFLFLLKLQISLPQLRYCSVVGRALNNIFLSDFAVLVGY